MKSQLIGLILSLFVFLFWACGREESESIMDDDADSSLVWATEEERRSDQVKPYSYLVAFRSQTTRSGLYFSSPVQQRRFHESWLADVRGMASRRYLASLDLRHPGRSFAWQGQMPQTPPQRFFWSADQEASQEAHITQVDFADEDEARAAITSWYQKKLIWYAEPNYRSQLQGELEENIIENFSDETQYPWLAQVRFIDAIETMIEAPANDRPVIAVMDSGVDVTHPALTERVFFNEQGQNKLCRNDIYGCNTTVSYKDILGDGAAYPAGTGGFGEACLNRGNCWHGTHVAGIIAADGGSEYTGVCPYCRILNVKVVDIKRKGNEESFSIQDSSIIAGLAYVSGFTSNGQPLVRVINASFGKFQRSRSVELFIRSLKDFGRGVLMVAAAGNEDTMKRQYPAAFDDVIAVSNVRSSPEFPQKSASSNFGVWVDIAAPGDGVCFEGGSSGLQIQNSGILSSAPGGLSGCLTGTSMASPVVAGIAGLILAKEPELTYDQLRARLVRSSFADNLYKDGINNAYRPQLNQQQLIPLLGSGVVNAYYALNPEVPKTAAALTEKPEIVRPGCAVVGLAKIKDSSILHIFASAFLLLAPLLILFLRRRWSFEG
ncbi:MAG: S8 family peptidase [Oligoflexus sp.]